MAFIANEHDKTVTQMIIMEGIHPEMWGRIEENLGEKETALLF